MTDDHETIFLEPACAINSDEGRQWCEDDVWGECDDCGMLSVAYIQRDHALALVAEAYEVAAVIASDNVPATVKAAAIRAMTDADALAAREADRKRVRDEALREALEKVKSLQCASEKTLSNPNDAFREAQDAILALIEGDQTDE